MDGSGSHLCPVRGRSRDRKSTRLNSSHSQISYAVFCLKKKKKSSSRSLPSRLTCLSLTDCNPHGIQTATHVFPTHSRVHTSVPARTSHPTRSLAADHL